MKLHVRLLLGVSAAACLAALYAWWHSKELLTADADAPRSADELYVDWALEQLQLVTAGSAAGKGVTPDARPNRNHNDTGVRGRCSSVFTTNDIHDILAGEIDDKPADQPSGLRGPTTSGRNVLQVIVVPFAHSDPGWLLTLEEYFDRHTRRTLDLMVEKLQQYEDMKFVWSESVFLYMWWKTLSESKKAAVRRLIASGKLEVAHGSWVVADEAVTTLYALIDNMALGHEFVQRELDSSFTPRHSWALDIFGYSSTSAYLQSEAGLEALVIVRVHAQVKSLMQRRKALEFHWYWHGRSRSRGALAEVSRDDSIICHVEPGRLYSIPESCGPESRVCQLFDFRHIKRLDPVGNYDRAITPSNVAAKAELLAEQYHLKAQLFAGSDGSPAPVILVPLGDDFRYDEAEEWDQQYANYRRLFDHFAAHPELGVQGRFGTPSDYFALAVPDAGQVRPCLGGDFYPYSDEPIYKEYWTGFYSTRMWLKVQGRALEQRLRLAQMLHTYSVLGSQAGSRTAAADENERALQGIRQSSALFAHHDAVTGTSKAHVASDYSSKLIEATRAAEAVAARSLGSLMFADASGPPTVGIVQDGGAEPLISFGQHLIANVSGRQPIVGQKEKVINVSSSGVHITFFNPLSKDVETVVHVLVNLSAITLVHVTSDADYAAKTRGTIKCQINPVFEDADLCPPAASIFQLAIQVKLHGLDAVTCRLLPSAAPAAAAGGAACLMAKVTSYASDLGRASRQKACLDIGDIAVKRATLVRRASRATDGRFQTSSRTGRAFFSATSGFLLSYHPSAPTDEGGASTRRSAEPVLINMHAATYGASRSGAYVFRLPTPEQAAGAEPIPRDGQRTAAAVVKVVGPVESVVVAVHCWAAAGVAVPQDCLVSSVRSTEADEGLHLGCASLLASAQQLVVRMNTSIDNGRVFYTDSNGLSVLKRRTRVTVPVSGNYYPVTAAAMIEGNHLRVTLLAGQPVGATSLLPGQLEVMIDRMTYMDDGRGMGEGVTDNRWTATSFRILVQSLSELHADWTTGAVDLSPMAHAELLKMQSPVTAFLATPPVMETVTAMAAVFPLAAATSSLLPCGGVVNVVSLRLLPPSPRVPESRQRSAAVVLHAVHTVDSEPRSELATHPAGSAGNGLTTSLGTCPALSLNLSIPFNLAALFKARTPSLITRTTLSMMRVKDVLTDPTVHLSSGRIYTFNVTFSL